MGKWKKKKSLYLGQKTKVWPFAWLEQITIFGFFGIDTFAKRKRQIGW